MYFPYIRGRQYELLALKELCSKTLISEKIIPIVEPVKLSSTLINTMAEYVSAERKLCAIINPDVGNFLSEYRAVQEGTKEEKWKNQFENILNNEYVIPSGGFKWQVQHPYG